MEKNKSAGLVYCNSRVIDEIKNEQYLVSDIKADQIGGRWSFFSDNHIIIEQPVVIGLNYGFKFISQLFT